MKNRKVWLGVIALFAAVAVLMSVYYFLGPKGVSGSKEITLTVMVDGKEQGKHTIQTDEEFLRGALEQEKLVTGDESETGLFVKTVDGVTADESKQQWWCFSKNDEDLMTGVDVTPIEDGDAFTATLKEGW